MAAVAAALPRALSRLCPRRCRALPRPAWTGGHRGHRGDSGCGPLGPAWARWARPAGAALAFLGGERGGGRGAAGTGHRAPGTHRAVPAGLSLFPRDAEEDEEDGEDAIVLLLKRAKVRSGHSGPCPGPHPALTRPCPRSSAP